MRLYHDPETGHLERLADQIASVIIDAMLPSRMMLHEDGRIEPMPPAPPHPVLAEALERLDRRIAEIRQRQFEERMRRTARERYIEEDRRA